MHITPPSSSANADGSKNSAPGAVTSIPSAQSDARALLVRHQLAALWTPRHTLSVQSGASYAGGLFTIHVGEVRALREGQGGGVSSPGVVVCISTRTGDDEDEGVQGSFGAAQNGVEAVDFGFAQAAIRELWGRIAAGRDLGRAEVREVFMVPGDARPGKDGKSEARDAVVRMWCEVLRLRG